MENLKEINTLFDCVFPNLKLFKEGKVRSVFDFDDSLLIVTSDRISAFDHILNQPVPHKGRILTNIAKYWFEETKHIVGNHLISTDFNDFPTLCNQYKQQLENRCMFVKKTELIEFECVIRGYIAGSGWKDYQNTGAICGHKLPDGLNLADQLPEPIFTPATKAVTGHDENVSIDHIIDRYGSETATKLKNLSLELYNFASKKVYEKGLILADTKFEFGFLDGEIILIDEIFTPDSSRYWDQKTYKPGISPPSFDKQIMRDYLTEIDWNGTPPTPDIPDYILQTIVNRYLELENIIVN